MRLICLAFVVLALLVTAACSSNNTSSTPLPDRAAEKFSVATEEGLGTFNPVIDVTENATGATVTINAEDATDLAAAYVNLNFDAERFTPVSVEFSDFLGTDSEVLTLALTDVNGTVPIGVRQIENSGVLPKDGAGTLATVQFAARPFVGSRGASQAPGGTKNAVDDLQLINPTGTQADLTWEEKNSGDYNNDGLVSINDLTPLGGMINTSVAGNADPVYAAMVDGNDDGQITISDLTPIGGNFGNQLTGYVIYSDVNGTVMAMETPRPVVAAADKKKPVQYLVTVNTDGTEEFTVRPKGSSTSDVGPVSNKAESTEVPGPPEAPTGLAAEVGPTVGPLKIKLTWTASASGDVNNYIVERKLTTDPESSFAPVVAGGVGNATTYTDQSGLSDTSYSYRVIAEDVTDLPSTPSTSVDAQPYILIIAPPVNVSAVPSPGSPSSILVDWEAPQDDNADRFTVYRKGPADADYAPIFTSINSTVTDYTDGGLEDGMTYSYYVTSRDQLLTLESDPSAFAECEPSDALLLAIESLTTDKTTHCTDGSEAASNITVQTNAPAGVTFDWNSSLGTVSGSGATVTWKPTGNPSPQVVTIDVTAHLGAQTDTASLKLYLTDQQIQTTYNISDSGNIGLNGKYVDFERPSVQQSTAPFKKMSEWFDGNHVVLYNLWEIWCPPCRGEMPEMHEWAETYESFGYVHIGHSSTYSLQQVTDWASTNGMDPDPPVDTRPWNKFYLYNVSEAGTGQQWQGDEIWDDYWSGYGHPGMSLPRTQLFDRDGYCRLWSSTISGSTVDTYVRVIKELTGAP
jgi:thiol-disulfide isomerase/thioredoxin